MMIPENPIWFLLLAFLCIAALVELALSRRRIRRLEKHLGYSGLKVTRIYRLGRMVKETIESMPEGEKDDGTLPLPEGLIMQQDGVVIGSKKSMNDFVEKYADELERRDREKAETRMSGLDERR